MEILYCRTFAQEFGIVADSKINAGCLTRASLQGRNHAWHMVPGRMVLRMTTVCRSSFSLSAWPICSQTRWI